MLLLGIATELVGVLPHWMMHIMHMGCGHLLLLLLLLLGVVAASLPLLRASVLVCMPAIEYLSARVADALVVYVPSMTTAVLWSRQCCRAVQALAVPGIGCSTTVLHCDTLLSSVFAYVYVCNRGLSPKRLIFLTAFMSQHDNTCVVEQAVLCHVAQDCGAVSAGSDCYWVQHHSSALQHNVTRFCGHHHWMCLPVTVTEWVLL